MKKKDVIKTIYKIPKNYQELKKLFSGKEKPHTFKNSVISYSKGEDIIDVTVEARGPEVISSTTSKIYTWN